GTCRSHAPLGEVQSNPWQADAPDWCVIDEGPGAPNADARAKDNGSRDTTTAECATMKSELCIEVEPFRFARGAKSKKTPVRGPKSSGMNQLIVNYRTR